MSTDATPILFPTDPRDALARRAADVRAARAIARAGAPPVAPPGTSTSESVRTVPGYLPCPACSATGRPGPIGRRRGACLTCDAYRREVRREIRRAVAGRVSRHAVDEIRTEAARAAYLTVARPKRDEPEHDHEHHDEEHTR